MLAATSATVSFAKESDDEDESNKVNKTSPTTDRPVIKPKSGEHCTNQRKSHRGVIRRTVPRHKIFQKLYGRDAEQEQLLQTFKRCLLDGSRNHHGRLSVISGPSGSGKSALARSLEGRAEYFLLGKCDQIQQGCEPLGPFVAALSQFTAQVLRKDPRTVQEIRSTAQETITQLAEVSLLTNMVPSLAQFFPPIKNNCNDQTSTNTTRLQNAEADNPTTVVVRKFLRSLCSTKRSIVLVIDDVQWIDTSSLELLEYLACDMKMVGLMLLATCRDEENHGEYPFYEKMKELEEKKGMDVTTISVGNLTVEDAIEMASEKFPTLSRRSLDSVSRIIHRHTKGNVFFTTQILDKLERSGWSAPKQEQKQHRDDGKDNHDDDWSFEDNRSMVDRLVSLNCDELVDFVVADTANKSPLIGDVLKTASCLGTDFATSHVIAVVGGSADRTLEALDLMEERGFIIPRKNESQGWTWTHDKYQKAAYLLIGSSKRKLFHLTVGRRLLSTLERAELEHYIFIVVSQYCIALKYIEEHEVESVVDLLLCAGERSACSSSFSAAASYFSTGMSLLKKEDNWDSQYDLTLRLYNAAAEIECCRGNFGETDKLVNVILRHARCLRDKVRAYGTKVWAMSNRVQVNQNVCLMLEIFEQLGEKFPRKPKLRSIVYEAMSTKWLISKKSEDEIMNLPLLQDWKKIAIQRILHLGFPGIARGAPELAPLLACRCIKFTLKCGVGAMSCSAFGLFGHVLAHPLGFIEESNKCARIAQRIVEKFAVSDLKCKIDFVTHSFCYPYKRPLSDSLEPIKKVAPLGVLTGDLHQASFCNIIYGITAFLCGWQLDKLVALTCDLTKKLQGWKQHMHLSYVLFQQQMMNNFIHPTSDPCCFTGKAFDEAEWMEKSKLVNDVHETIVFWLYKSFIALYLGEYDKAKQFMKELMSNTLMATAGVIFQIYFLDALIDVVWARETGGRVRKLKSSLGKLRFYFKHTPDNVVNKILLVEAELAALRNQQTVALTKFKKSIGHANRLGLIHEEALAYERCAVALLEWEDVTQALEFFERAKNLYEYWGAPVKVKQLVQVVRVKMGMTNVEWE